MLLAVVELIAECGVAAVSMRDVAEASGVSVGRVQHHFGTRRNLMHRAQEWYLKSVIDHIAHISAGPGDPWDKLMRMCLHASTGGDQDLRAGIWIDLLAESRRDPEVRLIVGEINARWCAVMEESIAEGVAAGVFHPALAVQEAAQMLVMFVDGVDVAELTGPPGAQERDHRLPTLAALLLGLKPSPGKRNAVDP